MRRRGVYLAGPSVATALGAAACATEAPPDAPPPPAVLTALAVDGTLLPLTVGAAEAWRRVRAWEAADGACPAQEVEGDTLRLRGGCTLPDGDPLDGDVHITAVPDGGTWVFDDLATGGLAWSGTVVWVRTDESNQLTATGFSTRGGGGEVRVSGATFSLADDDTWATGSGRGEWRAGDVGTVAEVELVAGVDCATGGSATWRADDEQVSATLAAPGCGCSAWNGAGADGEWCE